jgi:hypothetical protein
MSAVDFGFDLMLDDYRAAAAMLWGDAAWWLYYQFEHHNRRYFGNALPPLPIVFGLSAYGHCTALTRHEGNGTARPRISIATQYLKRGRNVTSDTLLHEMVHVQLLLKGEDPSHNGAPWCREIIRITPLLGLPPILAEPVKPSRDGKRVVRRVKPGHLTRAQLSRWPHTVRPNDYPRGEPLCVSSY